MSHGLLLLKLHHYGIHGATHQWIRQFLSNRTQELVVDGVSSRITHVTSGVPPGSVLGPILFLLFINDLPSYTQSSKVRLFADDCMIYRNINSDYDRELLQNDLDALLRWESDWGMNFHPAKCVLLSITLRHKPVVTSYHMRGHQLARTNSAKYLGVTLNSKMSWSDHISTVTSKAFGQLAFLQRNIGHCPQNIKVLAYQTLVRPKLEYCSSVWSPHAKKDINRIEMVQRKDARIVMGDYGKESSVTKMLQKHGWSSLEERRDEARAVLFYKARNDHVKIDIPLLSHLR